MATLQQVILDNNWRTSSFLKQKEVNKFISSGAVSAAGNNADAVLNALEYDNVQSVIKTGLVDSDFTEQNLGDATNTNAGAIEPVFTDVDVKTFYGNQWWMARTIQGDLMASTKPKQLIANKVGGYWATQWNKLISATVSGMSDIAAITIGDGTTELSATMIINARKLKGDMGFGKLAKMYMNSTTIADILEKQALGTIPKELITEKYNNQIVHVEGVQTVVTGSEPEYVYNGATRIVIDDAISDGVISLVEDGAFAFSQKQLNTPVMYNNNPKGGNGSGIEEFGTKSLYILHPIGFTFVGVLATDYASKSGLTVAELQAGGLYGLAVDPKLAPITNLKVKIG